VKYVSIAADIASVVGVIACQAQQDGDKAKAIFDAQMFGGPLSLKTYASFVRRYGSNRPAQHPKQKVSAISYR
jgi:hypothetical protein